MCIRDSGYAALAAAFETAVLGVGRRTADGGVWVYAALSLALTLFQFPLATTITSLTTSRVPAELKGTLVGFEHAIFAAAGLAAPLIGVTIYQAAGLAGAAAVSAVAYAALHAAWRQHGAELVAGKAKGAGVSPNEGNEPRRSPRLRKQRE